jgi:hypothetical protein
MHVAAIIDRVGKFRKIVMTLGDSNLTFSNEFGHSFLFINERYGLARHVPSVQSELAPQPVLQLPQLLISLFKSTSQPLYA